VSQNLGQAKTTNFRAVGRYFMRDKTFSLTCDDCFQSVNSIKLTSSTLASDESPEQVFKAVLMYRTKRQEPPLPSAQLSCPSCAAPPRSTDTSA
jgi:hypothetical protein